MLYGTLVVLILLGSASFEKEDQYAYCKLKARILKVVEKPTKEKTKEMINFFKICIKNMYQIVTIDENEDHLSIPDFEEIWNRESKPGSEYFTVVAEVSELFFKSWLSWKEIINNHLSKTADYINCEEMFWITAARYIYYTHVLYKLNKKLILCEEVGEKIIEPESVCYLKQSGSLTLPMLTYD